MTAEDNFTNSDLERINSDELNSLISTFIHPHVPNADNNSTELKSVTSEARAVCRVPCTKKWGGEYNFGIYVPYAANENLCQKSWVYSTKMEKVFINTNVPLPIEFKWDNEEPNLFVRALPVYFSSEYFSQAVTRCQTHARDKKVPDKHPQHVVRCNHKASLYEEDKESERFSVVTPLIPTDVGTNKVVLEYKFMCKNSDVGGMNRRPIFIIFTLERENGHVLGRDTLKVRICSCPKRDKEKEEANKYVLEENSVPLDSLASGGVDTTSSSEEEYKQEMAPPPQPPPGKKRKMNDVKIKSENEADDGDKIYQIEVFSHRWYKYISTIAHDQIVGHAIHHKIDFTPTQKQIVDKLLNASRE